MRGRPPKSPIRQNIVNILAVLHQGYGYQICKIYKEIFPQVTQRSIYYQLRKGVKTKEIEVVEVKQEEGEFSWGKMVEKTYYKLGEQANPQVDHRITRFLGKNQIAAVKMKKLDNKSIPALQKSVSKIKRISTLVLGRWRK